MSVDDDFVYKSGFFDLTKPAPLTDEPTFWDYATSKLEESFPAIAYRWWNQPDFEQEIGFDPMRDRRFATGGSLAKVKHRFAGARSEGELEYQIERFSQEMTNLQTIKERNATYGFGLIPDLAMDPLSYVPLVGMWSKAAKAGQRFASGAAVSTAFSVPYETIRHQDSMVRSGVESSIVVGSMFILGGAVSSAFGRRTPSSYQPISGLLDDKLSETGYKPRSLGAAAPVDPEDLARQESLIPTGTGLETVTGSFNPILRAFQSNNPAHIGVVTDMVETGGLQQRKILEQIPQTANPVTVEFRVNFLPRLNTAINKADDAFLRFRGVTPTSDNLFANAGNLLRLRLKDFADKNTMRLDFNKRVGLALMRGSDNMDDAMTPFVNDAAASYKEMLDYVRVQAEQVGLFAKEFEKQLAKLRKDPDGNASAIRRLEAKIANLRSMGAMATINSKGYFPRVYDVDFLLSNEGRSLWYRSLAPVVGRDAADAAYKKITNSFDDTVDGFDDFLNDVAAGSAKARMLDVDDELLVPFLDFNVESVIRDHVRRMGMDIELTRKFGSIGMEDVIDSLPTRQAKKDVTALRDILRGTYERPSDPHSHLNRGITLLKNFSPLVYMGGAAVSSLPDIARPIMTEGINAVAGTLLQSFHSANREIIKRMNRKMVREVGEALDMTLSMRAFAMADIGSSFGRASHLEKTVKNLQAPYFLLNGLNVWNTAMKEFAGLTISQRMFKAIRTDWQKLNSADKKRLLSTGIDGPMSARINAMMNVEGFSTQVDGMVFPELAKWTDQGAADAFKRALNQQINRTIVTPDAGDRALWTQTHVGSMIAQFKSFGQASTTRVLISGLQERNANFWHGAILMTSLGILVNEMKDFQYGSTKERTWGQVLSDGIDRSGLLAVFSDINHALETVSSNRVGLDALAGGQPTDYGGVRRTVGEFGPSASILYDFANMGAEAFQGDAFSQSFMDSMKRTTPYMSHPLFPGSLYDLDSYSGP